MVLYYVALAALRAMTGHGMETFPYVEVRERGMSDPNLHIFFVLADYEEPKLMDP